MLTPGVLWRRQLWHHLWGCLLCPWLNHRMAYWLESRERLIEEPTCQCHMMDLLIWKNFSKHFENALTLINSPSAISGKTSLKGECEGVWPPAWGPPLEDIMKFFSPPCSEDRDQTERRGTRMSGHSLATHRDRDWPRRVVLPTHDYTVVVRQAT